MDERTQDQKDEDAIIRALTGFGLLLVLLAFVFVYVGVWTDMRWVWTSIVTAILGIVLYAIGQLFAVGQHWKENQK